MAEQVIETILLSFGYFIKKLFVLLKYILYTDCIITGYVLSKEALDRFVNRALKGNIDAGICNHQQDTGNEDVEIGLCLNSVGVKEADTRDKYGKHRFHGDTPEHWMLQEEWGAGEKTYPFYPVKPVRDIDTQYAYII